jgi:phage terminase large subunit GpA-like protein
MLLAPFKSAAEVDRDVAEILLPPRRMKPSEAAARYLSTEKGPWSADLVPYMLEPLDMLGSREYRGICLVGPARTSKTMTLVLGGIAYVVTCSPADMLVTQMTQLAARDFSMTDLDRAIENSPELRSRMSPRARDDNVYDKFFRSGMMLKIGWPAASQLSSKTLKYVLLTDYDQSDVSDNVDGRGPMWDLAMKRTETYMSRGKTLAESSPSRDLESGQFARRSPHEAPPANGILGIYNAGTRAMRYLPCQSCDEFFLADPWPPLKMFAAPEFDEIAEEVQKHDLMTLADAWAKVACPHCGSLHEPEQKQALIAGGRWLHEGESLVNGKVEGERRRSHIASYWLSPVEAAYQTWTGILQSYLQAVLHFVRTGDEGPLKKSTNTDLGAPYLPKAMSRRRELDDIASRLEEAEQGVVPAETRFLTAAVDVQGHRFVVQVMGWGVGLQSWLVDRFSISASNRPEGDKFAAVDPAAYVEDWNVLIDQVIERKYRVAGLDLELGPMLVVCDSGGREGVTDKAYEFWRQMRAKGLGAKFRLVKGTGNLNAPRVQEAWPDAKGRKDRRAGRGDVPVWMLNVNAIKDGVHGDLSRTEVGPGYVHLPTWVDEDFFKELTAEVRTAKGWVMETRMPNEAFDLHAYNRAACIVLKAEAINWALPPEWATALAERAAVKESREKDRLAKAKIERPRRRNWVKSW